jgi:hypothetical protein
MNLTVATLASIEFGRFWIVPHRRELRTISGRVCRFTGQISTVAVSPYTQAVAGTAVPVSAPPGPPTNLAEPVSELIGRDAEFEEIVDLTAAHRPVTLTSAGGSGKTRLGLEVARRPLAKFADEVWAIELAPLSDPDLVPTAVADTPTPNSMRPATL